MRTAVALLVLASAAGCAARGPPTPTGDYLVDRSGDAEARFDLLAADLRELNGSLAIRVQVRNYAAGLPLVEARLGADSGDFYARLVPDPTRPTTPQVRAEAGRLEGDQRRDPYDACYAPSFPSDPDSAGPWWVFLELVHNRTGMASGGIVRSLTVTTSDADGQERDRATHREDAAVGGGPNPYGGTAADCPLSHEHQRLV